MRIITIIGMLVGLLVILTSCIKSASRPSSKTDYLPSDPISLQISVGVKAGLKNFKREEMGRIGGAGKGLIRVDWNNDGKDEILLFQSESAGSNAEVALIDYELKLTKLFPLSEPFVIAPSAADINGDGLLELCPGAFWLLDAKVYGHTGKELFTYVPYSGTDCAMLADLKKNHQALLIVGFNADGGLRAADSKGKTVFRDDRDLSNIYDIEAADLDGDGKLEVICSSGLSLTIWSSDLKYIRAIFPEIAGGFAAVDHDGDGKSELLMGSGQMVDGEGNVVFPGDKSKCVPFASFAVTADISNSRGLETAWAQDSFNNFKILAQKGKVLYQEGLKKNVTGLICTSGLQGWEPGFLLQLEDGTLIHFGRKVK
jgi:hypothetical protein